MKDNLKRLGDDYGLTPEGVRHAIEAYQDIICEITGGKLSKLTYDSDFVLETAEEHYERKYNETGKWTTHRTQYHDGEWYCDRCDYEPTVFEATPYCPNCGAMMELDK